MKQLIAFLIAGVALTGNVQAQSLVQKFAERDFILSDSFKSPDGFFYGSTGYKLGKGTILMIHAEGNSNDVRPMFIVRGPNIAGQEAKPVLNYFDSTYDRETNAVYSLPETGDYFIYIANGRTGAKGTIKTSMGLGLTAWLDDAAIFTPGNNDPFAIALAKLLREAIFNFDLIKGGRVPGYVSRMYTNTFALPGADMKSAYTNIGDYAAGCTYLMDEVQYHPLPKKNEDDETVYDQRDSIIAVQKYEAFKTTLSAAMPKSFTAGPEEKYTLLFEKDPLKNGRRIIYTYTGNDLIKDPKDDLPELLASQKITVELDLELQSIIPQILLKVYSKR